MNNNKDKRPGFLRKFSHHRLAFICMILLILEVLAVIFVPMILNMDPYTTDPLAFAAAPSATHILGTDQEGRDILARLFYGGRTTLGIGVLATAVSVVIGVPLGLLAGYYRGAWEMIIMRIADAFMCFPSMIIVLVMVAVFGSSVPTLIVVLGVMGWPMIGRLIFSSVLSVREMDYVTAARSTGVREWEVMLKYILPNSIAPLWPSIAFRVSAFMLTESGLSFLGCGVQPPTASWGNIIQAASSLSVIMTKWWMWIPAGLALIFTIVCVNFVGEGIRDTLDPKMLDSN